MGSAVERDPPDAPSSRAGLSPRFLLGMLGVVAIAAALRFWHLGTWSYWSDEAFTISDADALLTGAEGERLPAHRLSFWIYGSFYRWAALAGIPLDEATARFLPACFGIVGVAITALGGARAAGRAGALLGALLVALAPFHLYWSQNARSYALEVMLAIPAALLLGSGCLGAGAVEFGAGLALLGAAAFAHPTALTIVPGIVGFVLYARRRNAGVPAARRWWLAAGGAVVLGLLALSPLGRAIWVHFHVKSGASPGLYAATCAYYFRPTLLAAAAVLGLRGALRGDARAIFLVCVGFGTLATGFAASCVVRTNSQYVVAALPFLALLVGREIVHLAFENGSGRRLAAAALAAVLLADFAGGAFLYHGTERGHRAPWREACEWVAARADTKDLVVTTQAAVTERYLDPGNPRPRRAERALSVDAFAGGKFEESTRERRTVWFLVLDVDLEEWRPGDRAAFTRFLREECRAAADWPLQFAGKNQTLRVWRYDPL